MRLVWWMDFLGGGKWSDVLLCMIACVPVWVFVFVSRRWCVLLWEEEERSLEHSEDGRGFLYAELSYAAAEKRAKHVKDVVVHVTVGEVLVRTVAA